MARIVAADADMGFAAWRRRAVPVITTIMASLIDLLPFIASRPLVPDFAFLTLIAWRLLRPEIWTAQMALPLGLANDLIAGHPIGQSMALWTLTLLLFDLADSRVGYRDFWMDWLFAAAAVLGYAAGGWWIGMAMGSRMSFLVLGPQILLSLLAYPLVARLILRLDRWRLSR